MNLIQWKLCVRIANESVAVYIPGEGATCPASGLVFIDHHPRERVPSYSNAGDGVRYHRCPVCGLGFKSIEENPPVCVSKTLTKEETKQKKKHTQVKRR